MTDYFLHDQTQLTPADAVAAVIVVDEGRYLMQLRDQKPGIFYPGHWGLFGGSIDPNETPEETLHRELHEELALEFDNARPLMEFTFTLGRHGRIHRHFFEVSIGKSVHAKLVLNEGAEMRLFAAGAILTQPRVVPYDSFAIWLHSSQTLS